MELTVNLAKTNVTIAFMGQAEKAIPLCNSYFRGFLRQVRRADAGVVVSILEKPNNHFEEKAGAQAFEQLLSTEDAAAWLKQSPEYTEDFPIKEKTICSLCLGGLLLFNPDTAAGRIYLLQEGPMCFRPLYRLLWMYFAQVLGERGGCFVHAAAVVRDDEGYLFMGESGSGKSTLVKLCLECRVLSDDGPIFFKDKAEYRVYPSPYHQMTPLGGLDKEVIHTSARVKGLYFLVKDGRVFVEEVSRKEAFSIILKRYIHFFSYVSAHARTGLFDLFFDACYEVSVYYLHFGLCEDIWKAITGK